MAPARLLSQPSGVRGRGIAELEASLVYSLSSRTARATQRNPVSKNQKEKKRKLTQSKAKGNVLASEVARSHHGFRFRLSWIQLHNCDSLYMLGPGSDTIRRCGLIGVGVSPWEWV